VTLLTKNSDGTTTVINSLDNPSDATVSLPWPTPASGEYKLFITMRSKKSRVTTSDTVTVTVTP
jgi:hypothetical protein